MKPFTPRALGTKNIDVSSSSANVKLTDANGTIDIRIHNDGTATAWVEFGTTGVTASTTTGLPVPAGAIEVLQVRVSGPLYVAAIAAGSTGNIYFTPGSGI